MIRKFQITLGTGLGHQTGSHSFPRGVILGKLTDDRNMFAHKILREKTHSTGCVSDGDRSPPSRSQGSRCGQMTGGTSSASPTRSGEAQPSEVKGGQAENQQPRRELIMWRVSCGRPGSWKGLRASFLLLLSPANPWVCLCLNYPTTGSVCLERISRFMALRGYLAVVMCL